MAAPRPMVASRPALAAADVGIALWVVAWVVVGWLVAAEIRELGQVGDTLETSAAALEETADALDVVSRLPLVGGRVERIAEEVAATAAEARESAARSRDAADDLAPLLGVATATIPSLPALVLWVPGRVRRARDRRAVQAALRQGERAGAVDRWLAARALHELPLATLLELNDDPWSALASGDVRRLADAELARLGVKRPDSGEPDGAAVPAEPR